MRPEEYIRSLNTNKPIAIFAGLDINGMGVMRSLGRRGIPIIGLDPNPIQLGFFSRYGKKFACINPKNEEQYVNFLLEMGRQMKIKGVLFQGLDAHTISILNHRDELEEYYHFPMARSEIVEILLNKKKFSDELKRLNIPGPNTYFPEDIHDIKPLSREIEYPCIVKPIFSPDFGKDFSVKAFKVNNAEDLVNAYQKTIFRGHKAIIQEIIPGPDTSLYLVGGYFNHKSKPLGISTFKRIRQYPHEFGNGTLCISTWTPEIAKICISFLRKIKYHGIIDAELKKDPRDGKFKLIEINPRTGAQHPLVAKCGVDLPYMAYMDAIGEDVKMIISKKENIKWLYMFNDLQSSLASMRKGELSLGEWINSFKGEKECAVYASDDSGPALIAPLYYGYVVSRYIGKRLRSKIAF